jgi:tetratricopeptide (TPR) repeat protein
MPLWLPCAGWALLAACSAPVDSSLDPIEEVNQMVRFGRYAQAVEEAVRLRKEDPVNEDYELLHQATSVAHLLDRGRRATLQDQDYLALSLFAEALKTDPNEDLVKRWIHKTKNKMATTLTNEAIELAGSDSYQEAWGSFTKALEYVPDFAPAHEGLAAMDVKMAYRQVLAAEYYDQGIEGLVEEEFAIAASRFGYVRKYRDEDARLRRRVGQVDQARSIEHQEAAALLEGEGLFYAARSEYGQALRQDSGNDAAREGLERAKLEAEVAILINKGESALMRGEFEKAKNVFEEASALTNAQEDVITAALTEVEAARIASLYQAARRLEDDRRYPDALQAYSSLLTQAPKYSDVEFRMIDLQARVQRTETLFQSLAGQRDESQALRTLQIIDVLWPDYRDVPERIETLERRGIKPAPKAP